MDKFSYFQSLTASRDLVYKEEFWRLFILEVERLRGLVRNICEDAKDDIRFYQGQARGIKDVLLIPSRLIKEKEVKLENERIT